MTNVSDYFDRTGTLKRPGYGDLLQEFGALLSSQPEPPDATASIGEGQVVLVLPGFLANDLLTRPLRQFLEAHGFRTFGWEHGLNFGPTTNVLRHLEERLEYLFQLNGGPIAIVGISFGGLLARNLAYECPRQIRHVATLVSPFRLPTTSNLDHLFRLCSPFFDAKLEPHRLALPLPVPATAFYTRSDGVVAWESCRSDDPDCLNIEVNGPHLTICRNPTVLTQLVQRLAVDG